MKYTTKSLSETLRLGKTMASKFNTNVIGLIGDLGSGKTAFTKGVGKYFNIKNITSPTFVVMKVYKTKKNNTQIKNLVHIDAYRLENYESLVDIGIEEYLNDEKLVRRSSKNEGGSLVLIEWADKIKDNLPQRTKYIKFKLGSKENERIINI